MGIVKLIKILIFKRYIECKNLVAHVRATNFGLNVSLLSHTLTRNLISIPHNALLIVVS